jgi:aminoglycoside phosphotransferase (APT) family kinase protein
VPLIREFLAERDHYFREMKKFSFIHGDLCVDNILFDKDRAHYVDWEWGKIGDNAEDFSRLYFEDFGLQPWTIRLDEPRLDFFLSQYLRLHPDATLKERVRTWNIYYLFTDMLFCKWKVKHFHEEEKNRSKGFYEKAVQLMLTSLEKRLL